MPLFQTLPQPQIYADPLTDNGGNNAGTANMAYFVYLPPLLTTVTVTAIRIRFSPGGNGHFDVGLYADTNGLPTTRLAHMAATATTTLTVTGILTQALIGGSISIGPGRYWLAYWTENILDKAYSFSSVGGLTNCLSSDNGSNVLPANANTLTLTGSGYKPLLQAILSGGWA